MKTKICLGLCFLWVVMVPGITFGAIINGGFEDDFAGWTGGGSAAVVTAAMIDGVSFSPFAGEKMAVLSYPAMTGFLFDNYIYQDVPLEAVDNYLNFSLLFWTFDEEPFDKPGLLVQINNETWFSMDAGDIGDGALGTLNYTDWINLSIPVGQYYVPSRPAQIRISFHAGNTGDNDYPSGAFIDGLCLTENNLYPIVPIPGAFLIFSSGLIGVLALRRRRW